MRIDLVRCLIAVAETGSITKAGLIVGLSQSVVTRNIQALEDLVGRELVNREHRPLTLTREGERVLALSRRMLDTVTAITETAPSWPMSGSEAEVRIGLGPTAGMLLTDALAKAAVERHHPGRQVVIEHGRSRAMIERLLTGDGQVIVANGAEIRNFEGLEVLDSYLFRIGVYVRPGHGVLGDGPVGFDALAGYPVLGPNASPEFNDMVTEAFNGKLEVRDFQAVVSEDVVSLAEAAATSDALVVAAVPLVAPHLEAGRLVELELERPISFPTRVQVAASSYSEIPGDELAWVRQTVAGRLAQLGGLLDI